MNEKIWAELIRQGADPGHVRSMIESHIKALTALVPSAETSQEDISKELQTALKFLSEM